jgi:hypothetical protein
MLCGIEFRRNDGSGSNIYGSVRRQKTQNKCCMDSQAQEHTTCNDLPINPSAAGKIDEAI